MDIQKIIGNIVAGDLTTITGVVLFLLTFVQITPIKINPWSWIAKNVGKALNQEVFLEIKELKKDVEHLKEDQQKDREERENDKADACRTRLLRVADEIRIGTRHSEEFFSQAMSDIDYYEVFCMEHPFYKNSKAVD